MSTFEDSLLNGLPLADAAAFHVHLLGYDRPKVATAGGMTPPALPPTATGQQMPAPAPVTLPGTAMGQNTIKQASSDKTPEEVGKERARASISAEHEKDRAHKREHAGGLAGGLVGAAVGGMAMHKYTKGHPFGAVAGMLAGHHIAGKTGREVGAVMDRHAAKTAAVKQAYDSLMSGSPVDPQQAAQALDEPPAPTGPVTPAVDQATQQYLAAEQEATEMANTQAAGFYQQKLEVMREQLQQSQEEAAQLQQGQAAHQAELEQIQAQVADSTQKALTATDQVLKEQQGAAAIRMAYQQLRGQILNTVSSDPPMMGSDQAAMAAAGTGQAGAPGGPPGAAESGAPAPTSGPAGQAPSPGTPPGSPAPEGDPTVPNADGIAASKPMMDSAQPATAVGQKDQQKVGAALSKAFAEIKKRAPHAAAGAALGAAGGYADTKREHGSAKKKVMELGGKHERSFLEARELGKARNELTQAEHAKKHPKSHTAISAAAGAVLGASMGPEIGKRLRAAHANISAARAAGK